MKQELRQVALDADTGIEAYRFKGVMQAFPNHFHEHYVVGFIEKGRRRLTCREGQYTMGPGDILLLNPRDNHACEGLDDKALDYRCLNITPEILESLCAGVLGAPHLPHFSRRVVRDDECLALLHALHRMVLREAEPIGKQETLALLLAALTARCTGGPQPAPPPSGTAAPIQPKSLVGGEATPSQSSAVHAAREYIDAHCEEGVRLEQLSALCGLNQYTLIRSFAKEFGITPYRYLETVRVNRTKRLLETGVPPAEAAAEAGFADQSHFTRCFKSYTGLTPWQYSRIFGKGDGASAKQMRHGT